LYKYYSKNNLINLGIIFVLLSFFSIGTVLISKIYDISYDGQAYHQEAIIQLSDNWNPVYEEVDSKHSLWLNVYPKASWIFSASIYKLTNNIESGKILDWILIIISFCLSLSTLLYYKKISIVYAFIISFLLAFNPVSIYQSLTYYVDGQIVSLLISLIAVSLLFLVDDNKNIIRGIFLIIISLLIGIKFTGLIGGVIILLCLLWFLYFKQYKSIKDLLIFGIIGFLIGIIVIGFNPYITNTNKYDQPLYQIVGKDKSPILEQNLPPDLYNKSIIQKLFITTFYATYDSLVEKSKLKIPFTVSELEKHSLRGTGARLGGFGPLWGGVVILSLLLLLVSFLYDKKRPIYVTGFIVSLFITFIINPGFWWARYSPQWYLFPVMVIGLGIVLFKRSIFIFILTNIIIIILYLNIGIIFKENFINTRILNQNIKAQLNMIKDKNIIVYFGNHESNRLRLEAYNISYKKVLDDSYLICDDIMILEFSNTKFCLQ